MAHGPLASMDGDDRRWAIESAARTIQEMAAISNDPDLLKAAEKEVGGLGTRRVCESR